MRRKLRKWAELLARYVINLKIKNMPKEVVYVFLAFIAIAAIYFMYCSLRVNRKEGETSSVKDDSKKVTKMLFRYVGIAITFIVCMVVLVAIESQFIEPNKGFIFGDFAVSALIANFVGHFLKKRLG